MKKVLRVRFIEETTGPYRTYYMQYKKWFFWKTNVVSVGGSPAGVLYDKIYSYTKEGCLAKNLRHMSLHKDFVTVVEYPTIKKY
jgi:hypothetical protein